MKVRSGVKQQLTSSRPSLPQTPKRSIYTGPQHEAPLSRPSFRPEREPRRDDDDRLDTGHRRHRADMAPDPTLPAGAHAPATIIPSSAPTSTATAARVSLEELFPAMVKRVAWSGDGRKGTVRLELGAGELCGATLLVHADGARVRVQMTTPPGTDVRAWRERIESRLAARGLDVEAVEID
jgi:hypothetical protein